MAAFNPTGPPARSDSLFTQAAAAAALRLHYFIRRRLSLGFVLHSSTKSCSFLVHVPRLKDVCDARALQFNGLNCSGWSFNALSTALMSLSFFHGHESNDDSSSTGKSHSRTPRRNAHEGRRWTNILLASNLIVFLADAATNGMLCSVGAKINSRIAEGQLWRLVTSPFLHAGIGHLMVNCYSLNAIGPSIERVCGPVRYPSIYMSSAIAGSAMSYFCCKGPAVGASGAIFGLVGSYAVYLLRHRGLFDGTSSQLRHIAQIIALNLAIGLLSKRIDNWGHIGGLIGGVAMSWLVGPSWKFESILPDGTRIFKDKAPIYYLFRKDPK